MHRRPLGRGRSLALVAAFVIVAGCLLPWFAVGGDGLPTRELRAFRGSGILTFLGALATLALVALPYAAGDRPLGADRPLAYTLAAALVVLGLVLWPLDLLGEFAAGLLPDRAPGLWVAGGGALLLVRAVYDISREPDRT